MSRMTTVLLVALLGALLLGGTYELGRRDGAAVARSAQRAEQLRVNQVAIAALTPKLQEATRAKIATAARVGVAQKHFDTARSRVTIVDSSHASIDGAPAIELPPLVFTTIARADTLVPELRAQVIAERQWGEVWHEKAELLEQRVGLLEGELADTRRANLRSQIKTAVVAAASGALAVLVLVR